jgi:hypothetical protein
MKITLELTDDGIEWVVHEPHPWTGRGKWIITDKGKVQALVVGDAEFLSDVTEYTTIGLVLRTEPVA